MQISVIDTRSAYARLVKQAQNGRSRFVLKVMPGTALPAIVKQIRNTARGPGSIHLLRILCHGNAGFLVLGGDVLGMRSVDFFRDLQPYFARDAIGIALHSCGPASATSICVDRWWMDDGHCATVPGSLAVGGGRGIAFLRRFASVTGVPVRGGIDSQTNDMAWRFEGNTVVVRPDGQFVAVPGWGRLAADNLRVVPLQTATP